MKIPTFRPLESTLGHPAVCEYLSLHKRSPHPKNKSLSPLVRNPIGIGATVDDTSGYDRKYTPSNPIPPTHTPRTLTPDFLKFGEKNGRMFSTQVYFAPDFKKFAKKASPPSPTPYPNVWKPRNCINSRSALTTSNQNFAPLIQGTVA